MNSSPAQRCCCFLWLAPLINPPRAIPLGLLTPMLVLGLVIVALRRERPGRDATIPEPRPSFF
jgi:hypothetical protein